MKNMIHTKQINDVSVVIYEVDIFDSFRNHRRSCSTVIVVSNFSQVPSWIREVLSLTCTSLEGSESLSTWSLVFYLF